MPNIVLIRSWEACTMHMSSGRLKSSRYVLSDSSDDTAQI